jgi:putative hemolysin
MREGATVRRMLGILATVVLAAFSLSTTTADAASGCDGNAPGMADPAAVYCSELGYAYEVVDTGEGQQGICVLPDGSRCDAWGFLEGKCGQSYSYCARQGYKVITKTDGKDAFSREYGVCVHDEQEVGPVTELTSLSEKATRGAAPAQQAPTTQEEGSPPQALPDSFDWRNHNGDWMTSVKDQGGCGSCWAFSAVGVVEAMYNIGTANPNLDKDLSEEYLVSDCLPDNNCCGGWHDVALEFIRDYGISDEACFPYVDGSGCGCGTTCGSNCTYRTGSSCSDATCTGRCANWQSRRRRIDAMGPVSAGEIKQNVVAKGPLAVVMGVGTQYGGHFEGGIYRCTNDSGINHAVVIAGYDDAGGYWIVKNSWGSSFGDNGYFKVGYGECAIESDVYYAGGPPADVGGIAELPALVGTSTDQAAAPAGGSGWSAGGYAALAAGLAAGAIAVGAGGWYVMRRRLG